MRTTFTLDDSLAEQARCLGVNISAAARDGVATAVRAALAQADRTAYPTGTNLLGLVKHNAATHVRYFGEVFGRTHDTPLPRLSDDPEPNAEFWATPDETRDDIVDRYRRAWELADATITELPLDAVGRVPWWGDNAVTLHHVLVHVTAETQRHAGHADIIRELIDGSAGLLQGHDNLGIGDSDARRSFRDRVEAAARLAGGN